MGIAKTILRNAPIVSLANYIFYGEEIDRKKGNRKSVQLFKEIMHFGYAVAVLGALEGYYILGSRTGEWNPIEIPSAIVELNAATSKYDENWKRLFSVKGLADKDKNGYIGFDEQFDAWHRMDLINVNNIYMESKGESQLPKATSADLEKAIQSYEQERGFSQ